MQRAGDAGRVDLAVEEVGCPEEGAEEEEAAAPAAGAVVGAGGAGRAEGGGGGGCERGEGARGLGYEGAVVRRGREEAAGGERW